MADLGVISFAFALVIVAAIYTFGHISGCHINPAVTIGLAVTGNFAWKEVPGYVIAQVAGAIVGAAGIIAVLSNAALNHGLGVSSYAIGWGYAFPAEAIGTFILVFTVLGVIHRKAVPGFAGLSIGFIVFAIIVAVGPTSGGAINPARTSAPSCWRPSSETRERWTRPHPVYLIAEFVGAIAAAAVFPVIFRTPPTGVGGHPRPRHGDQLSVTPPAEEA